MVGILGLVTVCVVSGARPTSSYLPQTTDYERQPLVPRAHAVFDLSASEDRGKPPLDVQEQDLDKLTYLPLAFKGFCGFYLPSSQRFGFDAVRNRAELYDVSLLHAGWYQNFGFRADPPALEGLEFAQTIRLCQPGSPPGRTCTSDYVPDQQDIKDYAAAHPGALWLIGNEPDAPIQDCITPPRYAQLYHELYGIIKGADPSARVAIGGVVQGTPLRLRYLDMILQEYQTRYGGMIPVDVWNVHGFILQEHRYSWGCHIPCGITDVDTGILYNIDDHDNMTFFKQQIVAFRQWMNDHGERDKQLIVTEYGILMPDIYGFDEPRVEAFMLATFDYFLTASNPSYGYAADCGKLVQGWAWYSLDDAHFQKPSYNSYSHLFDPVYETITDLGTAYGDYVSSLP
ncbi:MAG: hypothetical protein CEE40_00685 [Chloroflexi bacterium B3_Chlor]|nr:MAG: hypothetical protein CEE40_00685 [Chloroflexi bacterium B3_Chlor]